MRVAKILVEIDHREGLHVDIEVAWGNQVLNRNLDFYKIPFHVRQHRYSNRGRTPLITTHITRSKINTPMFSRGKTPTGKHPRPQPTRSLGAVY
jgi:hypothetical protein